MSLLRARIAVSTVRPTATTSKPFSYRNMSTEATSNAAAPPTNPGVTPPGPPSTGDHGIPLDERRSQLVQGVRDLFCSKPKLEIFERDWNKDAIFEDPICIAKGAKEYQAQWYGMPKAFPQSETLAWKVVKNEPNLIEYEQTQKYTVAGIRTTKEMKSLVHIELDNEGKIVRFEDRWNGKELKSGGLVTKLRTMNGTYMPKLIKVPASKEQEAGTTA